MGIFEMAAVWTFLGVFFTAFFGYLLNKKKEDNRNNNDLQRQLISDIYKEIGRLSKENELQEKKIQELEKEREDLLEQYLELKKENAELKERNEFLTKKLDEMLNK